MAANKVRGVRAALCNDPYDARLARSDNDANVIAIGARSELQGALAARLPGYLDPF
jgi:ribose 5-phosphate isomerase RpiB